jgi:hypothetical protein
VVQDISPSSWHNLYPRPVLAVQREFLSLAVSRYLDAPYPLSRLVVCLMRPEGLFELSSDSDELVRLRPEGFQTPKPMVLEMLGESLSVALFAAYDHWLQREVVRSSRTNHNA